MFISILCFAAGAMCLCISVLIILSGKSAFYIACGVAFIFGKCMIVNDIDNDIVLMNRHTVLLMYKPWLTETFFFSRTPALQQSSQR